MTESGAMPASKTSLAPEIFHQLLYDRKNIAPPFAGDAVGIVHQLSGATLQFVNRRRSYIHPLVLPGQQPHSDLFLLLSNKAHQLIPAGSSAAIFSANQTGYAVGNGTAGDLQSTLRRQKLVSAVVGKPGILDRNQNARRGFS
jgi:hypothetical protein